MEVFTQILILLVVLACMVMVILAIRQLTKFEGFEDERETSRLKEEIEDNQDIISHNNIFHNLVDADMEQDFSKMKYKEEIYRKNSNDPLSRKE